MQGCGYPPDVDCDMYAEKYENYSLVTILNITLNYVRKSEVDNNAVERLVQKELKSLYFNSNIIAFTISTVFFYLKNQLIFNYF